MEKAQLVISRNRIGTDGEGIRTLVSLSGCPLNCRYCINPHLKKEFPEEKRFTPQSLLERVRIDRHAFLATGGGITFSGGEPLMHSDFILEFCGIRDPRWSIAVETSLYVPEERIEALLDCVDTWIVDIKTVNPEKYAEYTGRPLDRALRNLFYLDRALRSLPGKRLVVRLPEIPEYTDGDDVAEAEEFLRAQLGEDVTFDRLKYVEGRFMADEPDGKRICDVLRTVRGVLAESAGIGLKQRICTNTENCSGTCPACDLETEVLNAALDKKGSVDYAAVREILEDIFPGEFEMRLSAGDETELAGITLMGEAVMPELPGVIEHDDIENFE